MTMATSKNLWFPFFWNDYLNDTLTLDMLQHGAYLKCLLASYRSGGSLPSDLPSVFRMVGAFTNDEQKAVVFILENFFKKQDDNSYRNSRVDSELQKIAEKRASSQKAINTRWKKEKATDVHTAEYTGEDTDVSDPYVRNRYKHNNNRTEGASENDAQVVAVVSLLEEQHLADIGPWGDKHRPQMKAWIQQYGQAFMDEAITMAKENGFDESVRSRIAIMVTTYLPKAIAELTDKRAQEAHQKQADVAQSESIERQTQEIIARRDARPQVSEVSMEDFLEG
jgi:uncharacterized protein YdaU (DUF1376 family)